MLLRTSLCAVVTFGSVVGTSAVAFAQAAPPPPAGAVAPAPPAAPPPAAPQPAPAATPGYAQPAAYPPPAAVPAGQQPVAPPGYRLVPVAPEPPRAAPREIPYEDDEPTPAGYELHERPRRGLIIAGSIVTAVPWMFSVMGAVAGDFNDKSGYLLVPGIGPWLMLAAGGARDRCGQTSSLGQEFCSDSRATERAFLTLDGLMQTAGVIMYVGGYLAPKRVWVRQDLALRVVPTSFGPGSVGVGAVGTF